MRAAALPTWSMTVRYALFMELMLEEMKRVGAVLRRPELQVKRYRDGGVEYHLPFPPL
jgi:hypothetical protein